MSRRSIRSLGVIIKMLHELTISTDQGFASAVVNVFGRIILGIIATVGSEWTSAGSKSVASPARVSYFPDIDSVSEPGEPNIARFSEVFEVTADPEVEAAADAATERLAGWIDDSMAG